MKPVSVRPLADADIDAALAYVAEENPPAARKLLAAFDRAFRQLAQNPAAGSLRYAHVLPVDGLRVWPVTRFGYLIFYFDRPDHVDVVRVVHGARDIPAILGDVSGRSSPRP